MTICKNRIKPTLLRDVKTEALLVFIRTTLEEFFNQNEKLGSHDQLGTQEDTEYIASTLKQLLFNLELTVINSMHLRSLIVGATRNPSLKALAKKEEPLMVYYDSLVKVLEVNLKNGSFWIPELIVICLLSEWILEEEKSIHLYPFLKNIDYIDLINRYDNSKIGLDIDKKEVIMDMYKLSSKLIRKLKNIKYKANYKK